MCTCSAIIVDSESNISESAPDVPFVEVIPLYSYETNKLSVITTIFSNHNMACIHGHYT